MWSLFQQEKVHLLSGQKRLDILAQLLEVEATISWYNVHHNDFAPRNVMLAGFNLEDQTLTRVMLIDFNRSTVMTQPHARIYSQNTPLPTSPLYRHWNSCPYEFMLWVPKPHRVNMEAYRGWLKTQWDDSPDFSIRKNGRLKLDEPFVIFPPEDEDGKDLY